MTLPHSQPPAKWRNPQTLRTINELDLSGDSWTDDRVEALTLFWADGLSGGQIATRLGGVTRSAVIGKVHRLGLAGRVTTVSSPRRKSQLDLFPSHDLWKRPKPRKPAAVLPFTPRRAAPLPIAIPDLGPAPEGVIKLGDLKDCMCKWPVGDPMEDGFHFCGRQKAFGVPYCDHHLAIGWNFAARKGRSA